MSSIDDDAGSAMTAAGNPAFFKAFNQLVKYWIT